MIFLTTILPCLRLCISDEAQRIKGDAAGPIMSGRESFTFFFYLLHLSVKKRRIAVAFKGMSQRSIYPEQNTITKLSATPKNRHFSFSKSELLRPEVSNQFLTN